ncbi:hypothetical protein SBOR_4373 [Sclerotinia borealis F-4128]|uniref:Cell cycle control protein n=1 Tax=Sclerotinia borealis (strain F-4128) TaxID=1432307 RepID=W9CHB4_SCLBF|nr:hypothetical protein SBOR_4373 [Sclerotinia borealis F-4128]
MENEWSRTRESRKRSLTEMSQSHLRPPSSSPVMFRERPSNFGSSSSRIPSFTSHTATILNSHERRRTSHPHNPSGQSNLTSQSLRASPEMEANSRPAPIQRPPIQRRSEFVIDLTSDQDDAPSPQAPPRRANRMHASPRPPPRLGRSEARLEQVVDLTADDDDDTIVTFARERSVPLPSSRAQRLPAVPLQFGILNRMGEQPARPPGGRDTPHHLRGGYGTVRESPIPPPGRAIGGLRAYYENGADIIMDIHDFMGLGRANLGVDDHVGVHLYGGDFPAMPNGMDYGRVALQEHKPEHVAPLPVKDGFTRSPTESDIAICPSCEEELIHRKDGEEPMAKKPRAAPSRKDREEHPFWVVKDCGHVFCNKCFQNRSNDKISSFRSGIPHYRGPKNILCSVEDCQSHVKNKDRWVGIFL